MIFESITIFILLFIIVGLVYQFMYDIFPMVGFSSLIFYLGYIIIRLILYFRRKKKAKATESELKLPDMEKIVTEAEKPKVENKPELKATKAPETQETDKLRAFIQKNLKQGFKEDIIRKALEKQGWSKNKIDKAFRN